jgi:hypothetical protein
VKRIAENQLPLERDEDRFVAVRGGIKGVFMRNVKDVPSRPREESKISDGHPDRIDG